MSPSPDPSVAQGMTQDELPLEWWSDEELAEIVAAWEKEIEKGT